MLNPVMNSLHQNQLPGATVEKATPQVISIYFFWGGVGYASILDP